VNTQPIRIDGRGSMTLNGVRLQFVALLAMGQGTPEPFTVVEDKIAKRISRKIDKMKRKGYRPEYVAKLLGPWIQAEALAVKEASAALAPSIGVQPRFCEHTAMDTPPCPTCGWAPPSDGPRAA
jgi:hypothetical protein